MFRVPVWALYSPCQNGSKWPRRQETYRVAAAGSFHLAESRQVRLKDIHLLHQGGESRLCGLADLLVNSSRLTRSVNGENNQGVD